MLRAIHDVPDLKSACQRVSCIESIILSVIYLCFFFQLKSRFGTADPRLLIQSSLKTQLLLREPFDFLPSVAQRRTPIGISEVALRLPLIAVAFYTSQGVRLFTLGLQIPTGGFGLEHISTHNCSFALLHLSKPCSDFPSPFRRSNHPPWLAKITEASAQRRKSRRRIYR